MSPNGRILTTHVGSLPRPDDVVEQVFKVDNGEAVDPAEYDRVIGGAVADRVRHQADAGVDLVSDGEMSKIGYATYIRHRLSGFELGDVPRATPADLDAYPSFRDRLAKAGVTAKYKRPICRGPISYEHREPLERDLAHLRAAVDAADVTGGFMNAPSPGVIALFQPNEFYGTLDEYLDALADAMKVEYEGIVERGLPAADRRAGPRDGPPHHVPRPARRGVRRGDRAARRGDQPRAAPTCRATRSACTSAGATTRARTTSTSRSRRSWTTSCEAKPATILFEAANPRHAARVDGVARRGDPGRQDPRAGRHRRRRPTTSSTPSSIAQRIQTFAAIVGRERVIAGTDCGFGTWSGFGPIDPTICWAKLESLSEGAALASSRLF